MELSGIRITESLASLPLIALVSVSGQESELEVSLGFEGSGARGQRIRHNVSFLGPFMWLQLRLERVWVLHPLTCPWSMPSQDTPLLQPCHVDGTVLEFGSLTSTWGAKTLKKEPCSRTRRGLGAPLSGLPPALAPWLCPVSPASLQILAHREGEPRDK